MAMIFGADSTYSANTKLTNGYTLFDWTMRMNSFPSFWGRNLTGENRVTREEIEFLKERNCKVALIISHLSETDVSRNSIGYNAAETISMAKELDIPADGSIALFANIRDDWTVNHNWMLEFARILKENGYIPGFIGNTDSSQNFNFDRQCGHFVIASKEEDEYNALFWATEPKPQAEPEDWSPYFPSDFTADKISIWRTGSTSLGDVSANTDYIRDESVLKYFL